MPIKPGYQTSEWWLSVITTMLSVATVFGAPALLSNTQAQGIATVAALVASAVTTMLYTHSRSSVKKVAIAAAAGLPVAAPVASAPTPQQVLNPPWLATESPAEPVEHITAPLAPPPPPPVAANSGL